MQAIRDMTLHLDGAMWKQAESVVRTWKMVIAIFIQHKKCQNILAFFDVDRSCRHSYYCGIKTVDFYMDVLYDDSCETGGR